MQIEVVNKSKSLQGITDLTLVAPINPGLIDALDTRTYASRLRLLLKTLTAVRVSSREYAATQPFSDTVERIQAIHSFRLAILEPEHKLLLAVTFDSAWEPYIRIIWRDLGPLLDVIFCNTVGYVTAHGHSYEEYAAWIRRAQVPTEFFYADSALTVADFQYLRQLEQITRESAPTVASDLAGTRLIASDRAALARATIKQDVKDAATQGLRALAGLYRLVDMYPPDGAEGDLLLRAAHVLLKELRELDTEKLFPPGSAARASFEPQLAWFESDPKPPPPTAVTSPPPALGDIQGGILNGYDSTHGALLLCSFDTSAADARTCLATLLQRGDITTETTRQASKPTVNVAFTFEGLRALGLSETELAGFAQEFREGMEARAGVLGDQRSNHPRNWALPESNWPAPQSTPSRVQMSMVHMVVQLNVQAAAASDDHVIVNNPAHPLSAKVAELAGYRGVRVLSVQALRREFDPTSKLPRDHFGFLDGISQPEIGQKGAPGVWSNNVAWGDVLLGHPNSSDDPSTANPLLIDGSYLVIRKLRQNIDAFDAALERGEQALNIPPNDLKAKMMGRTVNGDPLVAPSQMRGNAFDYTGDRDGDLCPFPAHIRRANPRTADKAPVPRIVRRGMSYGPRYDKNLPTPDERGLVFMAYNASIAEQFEVIQRWMAGGNSTRVGSAHSDPILGVPQRGDRRTFRFQHQGAVMRFDLDDPNVAARPFVQLEWGGYFFAPSMPVLRKLAQPATPRTSAPWSAAQGEDYIKALLRAEQTMPGVSEQWKQLFEDISSRMSNTAASVWAAIREFHGGVLRTQYGVLVASNELVRQVFDDFAGNYSVSGYAERMHRSFGLIYLGLDDGPTYKAQASAVNAALMAVTEEDAFLAARQYTHDLLTAATDAATQRARANHESTWSATLDMKDVSDGVLARFCQAWFGVPDGARIAAGGWQWNLQPNDPPRCPAHFAAPSRYMFQPNPGRKASQYGEEHGQRLQAAFAAFVADQRPTGGAALPRLGRAIFDAFPDPSEDALLASTFIGVLMGFLPTVDGNLRGCLYEWINDRRFWDLQAAFVSHPEPNFFARAGAVLKDPLRHTMQLRPVPEVVWRTAVKPHKLGGVDVVPGDKIVNAIVSATQQSLAANTTNVDPIFGGRREKLPTHHTHSCPAYDMGMGVLLGIVTGLMEKGPVSPTPAPLTLTWSGTT